MKIVFTRNRITRTCNKEYADDKNYKEYLQKDFNHRCAYCDLHDSWIKPLSYQIDHFIPMRVFIAAKRDELKTKYINLMYACPACNRLKSDLFSGDVVSGKIENQLFYNPDTDDLNKYFYRDENGQILSDDDKGNEIIKRLQLYRPTKQWGWYLDELQEVYQIVEARIENETDIEKKEILKQVHDKIGNQLYRKHRYFAHSYANKG